MSILKQTRIQKANLKRIEVSQLPSKIPNYKKANTSKEALIANWLKEWIISGLKNNTLQENLLLPLKADLAYYLGVSIGTVQNAIRYVEDEGHLESKQRIGTTIKNANSAIQHFRKLTSKREKLIINLKKFLIENKFKKGDILPAAKVLAKELNSSTNTMRLALEYLATQNNIQANNVRALDASWKILSIPVLTNEEEKQTENIATDTLVDKIVVDLKNYIQQKYKVGEKMCSHFELSEKFKVSIKTIHDAIQILIDEDILLARRGRYGTTVIKLPYSNPLEPINENASFKISDNNFYNYQKIEVYLKNMIKDKYNIGDKIPSMEQLASELNVSSNTIKKALQNLNEQGYVQFLRGRYGGTFISDIPEEITTASFRWLAVNPQYIHSYKN